MGRALRQAELAAAAGEVPVGAVVYWADGTVLAEAGNMTLAQCDVSAHAEIIALRRACAVAGNYRLPEAAMAVTLEPCLMCAGAIFHARLRRLVYGATDEKAGACGGVIDLSARREYNHHTQVARGLMAAESAALLRDFFRRRRRRGGRGAY